MFNKGKLAYSFVHEGKPYGTAVEVPSKSVVDIASASLVLFTSALETKAALIAVKNLTKDGQ